MAQNITIAGAQYSAVPAVNIPKTGGGTATFYDVSGTQSITANGTFDVTTKASVNVNVQSSWPPATITAGDTPVKFVAGYQYSTGSSLMEVSRITITRAGTYRFRWVANRFSSTGTYRTQLWKNGVAVSEEYTPSSTTWVGSYSVDVACSAGDYVCVYARGRSDSYPLGISGFTACINGDNGF